MGSLKGKTKYLFIPPFIDYKHKHLLSAVYGPGTVLNVLHTSSLSILTLTNKQANFNLHLAVEDIEPLERLRNLPKVTQ